MKATAPHPYPHLRNVVALLFAIVALSACGKIELPSEATDNDDTETTNGQSETATKDTLSIAQAIAIKTDSIITVKGYIVGYIDGTSITDAVFGCPTSGANTNMLLADSLTETDTSLCLPVILEKGKTLAIRESLNLYDYPDNFHRLIAVNGLLTTYFEQRGLRKVYAYGWAADESDNSSATSEDTASVTIAIEDTPAAIIDGR